MEEWAIFKCNRRNPESEKVYRSLNEKNKKLLDEWLFEKSILSKSKTRAGNRKRSILKLYKFLNKDFDKINYKDYVFVASAISKCNRGVKQKNSDREFIKRFLKDTFEDWEKMFKKLELLKQEIEGEDKKLSPSDLLTDFEIEKQIRAANDMKKKTLVVVLSISAGRPEEILKLCFRDIDYNKEIVSLYSSKTKRKRPVPIAPAIPYLKRLEEESGARKDDLIFPSAKGKQMTNAGLNYLLQEISKKAGIKKYVWAYLYRHTRLSFLITKLSPKVYEEVSGHSLATGLKTYAHLSQDQIIQEMKEKVFEVEELPKADKHKLEREVEYLRKVVLEIQETNKKLLQTAQEGVMSLHNSKDSFVAHAT